MEEQQDSDTECKKELIAWLGFTFISLIALRLLFDIWTDKYAGILSLSGTLIIISVVLSRWGITWCELGLKRPKSIGMTLLQLLGMIVVTFCVALVAVFIAKQFFIKPEESSRFVGIAGNLPLTLWWILLSWLIGGFAEEMLYRAFLISGLHRILGEGKMAIVFALLIPGIFWAIRHIYFRGAYGAVFVFLISIVFGCFYILTKRNLWPNIILHGSMDTFGFINRYLA